MVKNLPKVRETWVWSLSWEDPLEKGMATLSSILAWRITWREEPGGLQSMGSQRVRHNWVKSLYLHNLKCIIFSCITNQVIYMCIWGVSSKEGLFFQRYFRRHTLMVYLNVMMFQMKKHLCVCVWEREITVNYLNILSWTVFSTELNKSVFKIYFYPHVQLTPSAIRHKKYCW